MYKYHRTRRYCRFYIDAFNFDLLNPTHSLSVNKMNHYSDSKKNPHVSLSARLCVAEILKTRYRPKPTYRPILMGPY